MNPFKPPPFKYLCPFYGYFEVNYITLEHKKCLFIKLSIKMLIKSWLKGCKINKFYLFKIILPNLRR